MNDFQDLILDGTKIRWHADRVKAWENGEKIAPITIDMALPGKNFPAAGYCPTRNPGRPH